MKIEDIDTIKALLNNLAKQIEKKADLEYCTNIHVSFNGPSQSQTHMNFTEPKVMQDINPDFNQADYDYNDAYGFMREQLNKRINYLTDRLQELGVTVTS